MRENQKKLSFQKQRIAVLNNDALTKILGGSEADTSETSELYSDGPPLTTLAASDGPATTTLGLSG